MVEERSAKPIKRFYEHAAIEAHGDGFLVALDGRPVRTPSKALLEVRPKALARAIAEEWQEQPEQIDLRDMVLTAFASTAIDRVRSRRDMVIEEISAYAETDLLCYRAEGSEPLVRRQAETWQPVLDWLAETHRADLRVTAGIVHVAQSPEAVARIREVVSAHRDFELAALHQLTTSMGSIVLALAVSGGHLDAAAAVAAAHLDDSYQAEVWGEDSEAAARLTQIELELAVAERYLRLCRDEEG